MLGLDPGTSLGVARIFTDGGLAAQTVRLEGTIVSRTVGVAGIVKRVAVDVHIEELFFGQFSSVKALFPMLRAAILACELKGLPRSAVHLARMKTSATGKGNAKNLRFRLLRKPASGSLCKMMKPKPQTVIDRAPATFFTAARAAFPARDSQLLQLRMHPNRGICCDSTKCRRPRPRIQRLKR